MENKIEKQVKVKAPLSQVWQALTDYREFGEWFRVRLESPFVPGQSSSGQITYPGYENITWQAIIQKIEPERYFSFTWHPYAIDPEIDYSQEIPTLIEFSLKEISGSTLLTVRESGFDKIPENRRNEAFQMNDGGWTEQMRNIEKYVTQKSQCST
jgi:uncharacterized protein YndB with AHSA1/START domain